MKITFLGTGTSQGIPVIGCRCDVCRNTDPKDKRRRASIAIESKGSTVIIDTTPEFRLQVLDAGIEHLDSVLLTHAHADHLHGLDDIRGFNHVQHHPIPCFGDAQTLGVVRETFRYIFEGTNFGGGLPEITLSEVTGPFSAAGIRFEPVEIFHGPAKILGYRFGAAAYVTDASSIPDKSMRQLEGLDVLVLNALRYEPHPTHFSVGESIEVAARLGARRTYFTHICHRLSHAAASRELPRGVAFAYDGLAVETADPA
jgi:phosphoribosyl 1,2-cyclic phosphate phosphodiesterase